MNQKYTSANTSVNSKKLPQLYKKARQAKLIRENDSVLDYGCGKYTKHLKNYLSEIGADFHGYDKYNRQAVDNINSLMYGMKIGYDCVLCSNVLNVIDDDNEMEKVIKECITMAKRCAVFTVYEGDKTGYGRETKTDCYQRNQPIKFYERVINSIGYTVNRINGMLVVNKF